MRSQPPNLHLCIAPLYIFVHPENGHVWVFANMWLHGLFGFWILPRLWQEEAHTMICKFNSWSNSFNYYIDQLSLIKNKKKHVLKDIVTHIQNPSNISLADVIGKSLLEISAVCWTLRLHLMRHLIDDGACCRRRMTASNFISMEARSARM